MQNETAIDKILRESGRGPKPTRLEGVRLELTEMAKAGLITSVAAQNAVDYVLNNPDYFDIETGMSIRECADTALELTDDPKFTQTY